MTRHILTLILLCTLSCHTAKAQEVYNYVMQSTTRIVNSPTSNFTQTQIAQFKRTALVYLKEKAFEQRDTVTTQLLDTQAYYLSEFVTLFFEEIVKAKRLSDGERKERIMHFMEASLSNPMFQDDDEETTMAFIHDGGEITPFCLNTDWQKAYEAAKRDAPAGNKE